TGESFSRAASEFIRAGRMQDAIQHADAAARVCMVLAPMEYVHGQVAAALAHDAAGDVSAACERYSWLAKYFGRAPSSVSRQLAATRLNQLSCKRQLQNKEVDTSIGVNHE